MARASTQIVTELTGKDQVSKTFDDVAKKAKQMQKSVNSGNGFSMGMAKSVAAGNAMFAVLKGVAMRAAAAAGDLGTLSDRAQQMQVSAEYAQKLEGALNQVGVKDATIDNLTAAFDRMQKATGRVGASGFETTMKELAGIQDEQQRVIKLNEIFGKSMGPGLAPLLRQGPEAFIKGLNGVMAAMPAVADAAVNAGDGIADAWAVMNAEIKVGFQQSLGNIANYFQNNFGLTMAQGIKSIVIWAKWGLGVGWAYFEAFGKNIGMLTQFFVDDWKGALDWVAGGITAWVKASLSPFLWIFDTVKGFAIEFGKSFVEWITGDEADWGGALQKALSNMGDASKEFKAAWADLAPTAPPGREWATVNMSALAEQRDASLAIMKNALDAEGLLASGGAAAEGGIADAADKAKNIIDDALKNAKFVGAGTYEALKLSLSSTKSGGTSAVIRGAIGGSSGTSGSGTNYTTILREMLSLQRKSTSILEKLEAL